MGFQQSETLEGVVPGMGYTEGQEAEEAIRKPKVVCAAAGRETGLDPAEPEGRWGGTGLSCAHKEAIGKSGPQG